MTRGWDESQVVRDRLGQFAEEAGGGFTQRASATIAHQRGLAGAGLHVASDEERAAFRARTGVSLPRGLTGVEIADDLDSAKVLARGRDAKGRVKTIYSSTHTQGQAATKFERVRQLNEHVDKLDHAVERDALTNDHAAALLLIRRLGMRPGSDRDTKAEAAAHGATNLRAKHVKVDGDRVRFNFVGKNGVPIKLSVKDPLVAEAIRRRLASKRGNDRLFGTTESKTRAYMQSTGVPAGFMLKDLRTLHANVVALQEVTRPRRPKAPRTKAEFARWRKEVAEKVSARLGNTPAMALSAYINPSVFGPWVKGEGWL